MLTPSQLLIRAEINQKKNLSAEDNEKLRPQKVARRRVKMNGSTQILTAYIVKS